MEEIKIIIHGNPKTKKNHSRVVKCGGRTLVIPSKQYKEFESDFVADCLEQKAFNLNIDFPVTVRCLYYMQTRRKVDLTNLLSATDDALQAAKIVVDDSADIIVSHDGSRVYYDKNNPRTEIYIEKYLGDDLFPRKEKKDVNKAGKRRSKKSGNYD